MKILFFGFLVLVLAGCTSTNSPSLVQPASSQSPDRGSMQITSPAFNNSESIPATYTCDAENISPPLEFHDIPPETKSLTLVLDDPDAPSATWIHWLVWNIDPATTTMATGSPPPGTVQGTTSFGNTGYGGPCPPSGTHHYRFTLYALDQSIDLPSGSTNDQLEIALKDHILATARLTSIYSR